MTPPEGRDDPRKTPSASHPSRGSIASGWARHNLLALGSAAVVTVYAAGYQKTREAADRFAMEDAERQRLPAAEVREAAQALSARLVESGPALSPDAGVAETLSSGKAKALRPESPPEPARKEIPIAQAARSDTEPASPVTTSASVALASSGGRQDQSPAVSAVQAAQASAEAPASPPPSPAPLQTADSVAAGDTTTAPVTPAPTFKDGTWSGWGSSRHGEIQVTVEIEDGRITSARITACQTRWSCRWVEHLQGQVVARQSAEVDYVSGATQSGNAFYFAAVAALAKAR